MAIDRVKVKKEADKLLTAGKVERAIDEFQKLVDDNPKDYNTLNQIGDLCVQIGRVKDMGSAAVFVLMMNVLLVWALILGPRYL